MDRKGGLMVETQALALAQRRVQASGGCCGFELYMRVPSPTTLKP